MTSNTQAMANINKVQSASNVAKPGAKKENIELNFNELFSTAMGQKGPNSQLNNIESQLRESLFKQDDKKNKESNSNAESAQAAQAVVWEQRNWMQTSDVPEMAAANPPAASNNSKAAEPMAQVKQANNQPVQESKPIDEQSAEEPVAPQAINKEPAQPSTQAGNVAAQTASNSEASDSENVLKVNVADLTNATANTPTSKSEVAVVNPNPVDETTQTAQTTGDSTRPQNKASGNAKVDNLMASATVNSKAETQVSAQQNPVGNANAVAAQLAPQIAQQARGIGGEELEPAGLKAGQKILAGGSLQAANAANGLAAGTNGLNGTLGNAQQALIKTPVNQPGFAKELGQTVQWAIGKNLSTVDIRVNPESFGPMNMRLVQKGQQVQLVIRTQDEASANLLTQALGGLKELLAQNGLQLNQVQIQHGNNPNSNGQNSQSQAQFEQQGNGNGRNGQQPSNGGTNQQEATMPTAPAQARQAEGKLDLFA